MSTGTDGTPPPSIAPRNPPPPAGVRTGESLRPGEGQRTGESPRTRPASAPVAGSSSPASTVGADEPAQPTVGERLRRAAQGVAETARNVVPSRTDKGDDERPASSTSRPPSEEPVAGPRRVRLAVSRIDPWSVMKLAFLLSVAIGIMIVVATAVVWQTLNSLEVFTSVNTTIAEITGSTNFFNLLEFVAFDRVVSLAVMVAVVDVVLLTALSTIGAFLYNIVAALVGGIHLTLTDD